MFDIFGLFFLQHAFPFGDDRRGDCVTHHVGRGTAHVKELVDSENERNAFYGQAKHGERAGDNHDAGTRHGGDAL